MVKKFVTEELKRICKENINESATDKWASPVVMMSQHNDLYRTYVDYCWINVVTIRDTYPVS